MLTAMLGDITIAVAFAVAATVSLLSLRPLHPVQLWTVPWAVVTGAFALHLLPYRHLSDTTAIVIVTGSLAFICGVFGGERLGPLLRRRWAPRPVIRAPNEVSTVQTAGSAALLITLVGLAVFLVNIAHTFGIRNAIVTSPEVRQMIPHLGGLTPIAIKYVYVALAGTSLNALAAALTDGRRRLRHLAYAAMCAGSAYFTTGRGTPVLCVAVGFLTAGLVWTRLSRGVIVAVGLALTLLAIAAFLLGGSLVGKTFDRDEISTIDSVFVRHRELRSLALPYQYLTAPLAALNVEVSVVPTWGRTGGCTSLAPVCSVLHRVGLTPPGTRAIRPFTARPLRWNTYTSFEPPLLDGGLVLFAPIMLLTGVAVGLLWAIALTGSTIGVLAYGVEASAVLSSTGQSSFLAPLVIGAILVALALTALVRRRRS